MANYKLQISSPNITNQKYPKYEWNNIFLSQLGKEFGKKKRMSLTCNGFTFQAKIDPFNYSSSQQKRNVQIPVINGIVIQDFGFEAEKLELKGSAGMDFYQKIQEADAVFNNQTGSGSPTPANLIFDNRVYTCFIDSFNHRISAQEATYEYVINLTVLQRGTAISSTNAPQNNSARAAANKIQNAAISSNGTNLVQYIDYTGKTARQYVSSNINLIPKNFTDNALQYIRANWSNYYENIRPYPGDDVPLLQAERLVIPSNWQTVLGGTYYSGPIGSTGARNFNNLVSGDAPTFS